MSELSVAVSAEFELELGAPATAGYVWSLPDVPVGVVQLGSHFKSAASAAPGDASRQVFRLRATQPGRFDLDFQLKRPWETTVSETRRVTVVAR